MTALSTPSPRQRRQHVLGGRAKRTGGIAQHGGEFGRGDGAHIGADFAIGWPFDAAADKDDAGVGIGRMHGQRDGQAGMDADAADRGLIAKRGLPASFHVALPHRSVTPMHAMRAAPRNPGVRVPISPKMSEDNPAADAAIPPPCPAKSPLPTKTLACGGISANSRFLTDCYLQNAAMLPETRRAATVTRPISAEYMAHSWRPG